MTLGLNLRASGAHDPKFTQYSQQDIYKIGIPLVVKVHFILCVQIAVNFFDLFWADYFHIQRRTFLDEFLLAAVQFFNLAVHIGKQDGIGTGQCVLCGKKPK